MFAAHKTLKGLAGGAALLAVSATVGSLQQAFAQGPALAPVMRSSGPILAAGGETILLCAANNQLAGVLPPSPTAAAEVTSAEAVTSLNVTLQIVNGINGAILAQSQVTLQPLGSSAAPPDPCVNYVVPAATFAPSADLFVARILLNPQPLPPGICRAHALSVSLQVYTPGSNGSPTNIRAIAFTPPDPCHRPIP